MVFSIFFSAFEKNCQTPIAKNELFWEAFKIDKNWSKFEKNRFFQNESGFNPDYDKWKDATWIGCFAPKRVRTLLLRREWKIDFSCQNNHRFVLLHCFYTAFTQEKVIKIWFWGEKSIFHPLRKNSVLTLLGAKQPIQVASFHLS